MKFWGRCWDRGLSPKGIQESGSTYWLTNRISRDCRAEFNLICHGQGNCLNSSFNGHTKISNPLFWQPGPSPHAQQNTHFGMIKFVMFHLPWAPVLSEPEKDYSTQSIVYILGVGWRWKESRRIETTTQVLEHPPQKGTPFIYFP